MTRVAPFINIAGLLLSVWTGYASLEPDALRGMNPDKCLCITVLIMMPIFAVGSVWIFGAKHTVLALPSWQRFSINWSRDPLQCLFLTACFIGGMALGAALHLPGTTSTGFWMFMTFLCMFIGLVVGQVIAYAVHLARPPWPNRPLKPTAPLRNESRVFAAAPCPGLSLSR
jgi:hypothetical protein